MESRKWPVNGHFITQTVHHTGHLIARAVHHKDSSLHEQFITADSSSHRQFITADSSPHGQFITLGGRVSTDIIKLFIMNVYCEETEDLILIFTDFYTKIWTSMILVSKAKLKADFHNPKPFIPKSGLV